MPITEPAAAASPVPAAQPARKQGRGAERLRWGLTGLAAIFLLVLIAAAGLRPAAPAKPQAPTGEPLAVLGVAPGAAQPAIPAPESRPPAK
jgi:hypothetical protein